MGVGTRFGPTPEKASITRGVTVLVWFSMKVPVDMNVNVVRAKKLTNIRAAGKDEAAILTPHREIAIEWALEWMEQDELLEATPRSLRLRKRVLPRSQRKRG